MKANILELVHSSLEDLYQNLIEQVAQDPKKPSLHKTPARSAEAMRTLTSGYKTSLEEVVNGAIFPTENDELIVVKDIEFFSLCEHHMLPFFGKCHVGYLPNKKMIGLSKVGRIVDMFARRLQVQEDLTVEIADAILEQTGALGVGVVIEAKHLCMMMRGVGKQGSEMRTCCLRGTVKDNSDVRAEFLQLIKN